MRKFCPFPVDDLPAFRQQLLRASEHTQYFCYLDSNNYPNYPHSTFGSLFALGAVHTLTADSAALNALEAFTKRHQDWLFGFLSYDLKNETEPALTQHSYPKTDGIQAPLLHFFVPRFIVRITGEKAEVGLCLTADTDEATERTAFEQLLQTPAGVHSAMATDIRMQPRWTQETYAGVVGKIKEHLQRGDIYEMNLCQEFYAEEVTIHPVEVFNTLNAISRAPFSCFFKMEEQYLLCASPERFLKKQHHTLISQPIKGTRRRAADETEDAQLKENLLADEKERSEHVMIVDLVRNDFSRIAVPASVRVEELYGIYTFEQVHQMISTIICEVPENTGVADILRAVFPMGSMTGAPKLSAMQLIDRYEPTKRGIYSGAVGYITPKGNFDFNVVIRSILYNAANRYVSVQAGSALTIDAQAGTEYEECLLKARAMIQALEKR
jgi:para-aminobenzoate synthetase component 1